MDMSRGWCMVVDGLYVMRWRYEDMDMSRGWCMIVDGLYVMIWSYKMVV